MARLKAVAISKILSTLSFLPAASMQLMATQLRITLKSQTLRSAQDEI